MISCVLNKSASKWEISKKHWPKNSLPRFGLGASLLVESVGTIQAGCEDALLLNQDARADLASHRVSAQAGDRPKQLTNPKPSITRRHEDMEKTTDCPQMNKDERG